MNYQIIYKSKSGNTKCLAEEIGKLISCQPEALTSHTLSPDCDYLFVGFWTDKGDCDIDIQKFLKSLHHQKIFLFGTAGFGGQQDYFDTIIKRVQDHLDDTNKIIGSYMCQGKMPIAIQTKYQGMLDENPQDEYLRGMLINFENALSHPDYEDLEKLKIKILSVLK